MIIRKKVLFILGIIILFFVSCKSKKENNEEKIRKEACEIFSSATMDLRLSGSNINVDSLSTVFRKKTLESVELGLEYAKSLKMESDIIKLKSTKKK